MAKEQKTYPATRMMMRYIKRLVRTGLYGDNESEVAGRLVAMSIRQLIEEKVLQELEPEPGDDGG